MNKNVLFRWVQKAADQVGLAMYHRHDNYHYVPNYFGTKAHKYRDIRNLEPFGRLARTVISDGRTKLYYDRLFTLYHALTQSVRSVSKNDVFTFCEVGTYQGGTMKFLCSLCEVMQCDYRAYVCDTFEGHDSRDLQTGVTKHQQGEFGDTSADFVRSYLDDKSVHLIKGRIQDRVSDLPDQMHFLHLDVDLHDPTAFALKELGDRLCHGGVIVVDDYGFTTCPGVEQAVREFVASDLGKQYFCFPVMTGQCVLVRY